MSMLPASSPALTSGSLPPIDQSRMPAEIRSGDARAKKAYQEALRLRPLYPQALEYLGEAYVQLGRLAEAREVLARLKPLDPKEADELAQAIAQAARR